MRHLRVKTKAAGLQIFFRLFLLVRGMDGIMLFKKKTKQTKSKSGIETNCNFDFLKTNSDVGEIIKWEKAMLLKHWLALWVQWNLQREGTVFSWQCWAVTEQILIIFKNLIIFGHLLLKGDMQGTLPSNLKVSCLPKWPEAALSPSSSLCWLDDTRFFLLSYIYVWFVTDTSLPLQTTAKSHWAEIEASTNISLYPFMWLMV